MPGVRIYPQDDEGLAVPTPAGTHIYLPQWRIRVWVRLGGEALARQAILDTGAPACILSQRVWPRLHEQGSIEWVCHPPERSARGALPRAAVLLGYYPFRLGRIPIQLTDLGTGDLPVRSVTAILTEDRRQQDGDPPELPSLLLIGLADVMNGRTLSLSVSADGSAWSGSISEP